MISIVVKIKQTSSLRLFMYRFLILFFSLFIINSQAAEVSRVEGKEGDPDIIFLKGEIKDSDEKTFKSIALSSESAIVVFDSLGGSLRAGLEIGKIIRIKGFATAVIDSDCASSCALAWLAGQPRMLTKSSGVGFHEAYIENDDGTKSSASTGNAMLGAYLYSLGLNDNVVMFVTAAKADKITLLNKKNADEIGLPVTIIDNKSQARTNFNRAIQLRWGKNPSIKEALSLYRLSAEEGFSGAKNNLGDMYESGEEVHKNDKVAVYWYTRSAERGEPTAYLSLATILAVSKDEDVLIEALKFAILAFNKLPDGSNKTAAYEAGKKLFNKLSVAAKEKAKVLAEAWEPLYQEKYLMSDAPKR